MRELVKSILRFSWATSLFGVRQLTTSLPMGPGGPSAGAAPGFQSVAEAAAAGFEGALKNLYQAGSRMQNGLIDAVVAPMSNGSPSSASSESVGPVDSGRLDTSCFVVLGEGLAAGMGDFSLYDDSQRVSFPAQMAQRMGTPFPQPLIEPPGIGDAFGFAELPVVLPSPLQSSVLNQIPPEAVRNLSVPWLSVSDAIRLRPCQPLVYRHDSKQTAVNLILGIRGIAYGAQGPLPAQLDHAIALKPTFAIVELGYTEAIQAAVSGSPGRLPSRAAFQDEYRRIVRNLRATGAEVLVLTIPDPTDTAHFSTIEAAARIVRLEPALLCEIWKLKNDDLITANGLNEIAFQLFGASIQPLDLRSVLSADVAAQIQSRVRELNQAVEHAAQAEGARVYDLSAFLKRVRDHGVKAGTRDLSAEYLGGFYSLNGYYPGGTGHALIANEILTLLNREFGAAFSSIDVAAVMASDPVAGHKPASGPNWTRQDLAPALSKKAASPEPAKSRGVGSARQPEKKHLPLTLPPGLEQVLPLNKELSYFGDGIAAMNCRTPQSIQFGSGGNLIFGGLAMVDSHLTGNIRIRFSTPVNGCTKFQVSFEGGLTGDDQVLAAPRFFKMAFRNNRVDDVAGFISSGTLNLATGQVETSKGALNVFAQYSSTALNALVSVNPSFPRPPAAPLSFPGQYGSACASFEQRPDGKLDFTFAGTTFVPLGKGIVWPLNFTGPAMQFATIPANGTVLHPHLALSTRETEPGFEWDRPPGLSQASRCPDASFTADVPFNTLEEYTLFAPISSFGDVFTLNAPQLGGPATGRSRLLGRVQIQFGPRCGNTVPIAVSTSTAGGLLAPLGPTPLTQLFPGRLTAGPEGFYEHLHFPMRSYSLNDLAIIDDPFDISIGLLDLHSGRLLHPLLHRGFINQDLIFGLLRVEPCTPQNSFMFRGPGGFLKSRGGKPMFEYYGQVHIPYPPGFLFPHPNLATGFPIEPGSSLDPYVWLWAVQDSDGPDVIRRGEGELVSSRGEKFSYRYAIPGKPSRQPAEFEYQNYSQQGKFRMHSLAWVGFGNSNTDASGGGEFDLITFSGFGVWSKDGVERVEQVAAQISTSPKAKYVGIQIGLADVSNVNTKMPADAYPVPPPDLSAPQCCIGLPPQPPPAPPKPVNCPPPPPFGAGA